MDSMLWAWPSIFTFIWQHETFTFTCQDGFHALGVDKQALVEDWLNPEPGETPEPPTEGGFHAAAPTVQHAGPCIAGPSHQQQLKMSKVPDIDGGDGGSDSDDSDDSEDSEDSDDSDDSVDSVDSADGYDGDDGYDSDDSDNFDDSDGGNDDDDSDYCVDR